jgi:DNA-binding LacI/PurR family transcriptional regulator
VVDVAKRAGVSTQTVSRVANSSPDVSRATRQRVEDAMSDLGYRPNSAARALKRGTFRTIGVVVSPLSSQGNGRILEAIALRAAREGFAITLVPLANPAHTGLPEAFSRMGELGVDAVIAVTEAGVLPAAIAALPPGVGLVVVGSGAGNDYGAAGTDHADGAQQAVKHLLELGHETVWHVAGPEGSFAGACRAEGWRTALRTSRRSIPPVIHGDWSADSGYAAGLQLADNPGCTAVFAANDHMALGMLRAFREKGKAVPDDISLIGFDDVPESSSYAPPLTTVRQDLDSVGEQCVDNVLLQVNTGIIKTGATLIPTELVPRQSTARPKR